VPSDVPGGYRSNCPEWWPNSMTVLSAGMVEKMVKWMPDPGPELAPLTDEARSRYGIDAKIKGI